MSNQQVLINIFRLQHLFNVASNKSITKRAQSIRYSAIARAEYRVTKPRFNIAEKIKESSYKVYSSFSGFQVPSYEVVKSI
jgi:hypothetical protein